MQGTKRTEVETCETKSSRHDCEEDLGVDGLAIDLPDERLVQSCTYVEFGVSLRALV